MVRLRTTIKLAFALLAVWLGLVWAGLLPRPAFLPPELDIEPLTYILSALTAMLFIFWKNPEPNVGVTDSHPDTTHGESLHAEIRKYLKSRYEHRIRQKLAGREPVNLRKIPSFTGTSDETAATFITLPAEKVPSGMADLFDEARGRLLVVGAPGAGKTTLLLQLALALFERPGKDLPVLLNLATWRSEFATFDEWLRRILPLELGASKALAEKIRRNTSLILLLDGLDEVPQDARASCLRAIGEYGAEAKHRFVISSRIAEYAATQDAPVYLEAEVQPLTPQQVVDNLTAFVFHQPEAKPLLNALQTDSLLCEAIANPFYLNTAQLLFAPGRKYSDFNFSPNADVAGRQRELVERFVEDALERKVGRNYPKEKARRWVGFLAAEMEKENLRVFELINLQYDWCRLNVFQNLLVLIVYGLLRGPLLGVAFGLAFGQVAGIISWLFAGIVIGVFHSLVHKIFEILPFIHPRTMVGKLFGLPILEKLLQVTFAVFFGLIIGLFIGMLMWLTTGLIAGFAVGLFIWLILISSFGIGNFVLINTVDAINWSCGKFIFIWRRLLNGLFVGLLIGLIAELGMGLIMGLIVGIISGLAFGLASGLFIRLTVALIFGLFMGLTSGLAVWSVVGLAIEIGHNLTGMVSSELIGGLIVGLVGGTIVGLIFLVRVSNDIKLIHINTPYKRFKLSAKNLHFSIIEHWLLRYQMFLQGLLPLRLVTFLNEMSLRHLLEFDGDPATGKGGGSWRWRHRIVQEYFLEHKNEEDEM